MSTITSASQVVRRDDLLVNELGEDELVMLDMDAGRYFGLQDVGTVIWQEIAAPTTVEDLCTHLRARFEVDEETCEREVIAFLASLHEQGLIDVQDPSGAA